MKRTRGNLSEQVKKTAKTPVTKKKKNEQDGNFSKMVSTGSTLLDLAISGGRVRGGGIPSGILVEIFGPSSSGKTALLCEIAGFVQRLKGDTMFHDPEARLDQQFATTFDAQIDPEKFFIPDTVTDLFTHIRDWEPEGKSEVNAILADSLAALSTSLEMEEAEGDKMGMRRAKEFSQELRRTCRLLKQKNYLMVCSNQIREEAGATGFRKHKSPGGMAIGFYSSLRLKTDAPTKLYTPEKKKEKRAFGIRTNIEVFKSSVWKPFRTAPVYVIFDYGIDDVRANLQYVKEKTASTVYSVNDTKLDKSMNQAIKIVEQEGLEDELREQVIDLWEEIEKSLEIRRKPKKR